MKVYKEYLQLVPNTPIYTDIQGELLTIEKQRNSIVAYFDADTEYYHKYLISNNMPTGFPSSSDISQDSLMSL